MQLDRRAILAGLTCTVAQTFTPIAEARLFGRGGAASRAAPGVLTTMTLVNTSGSSQASGFVTPVFGHSFAQGDIPSGTAPQFQVSGTPQPYSWGLQSYWGDGSLRHASFMFRSTASVARNGTLSVNVMSGGSAPTTSARTLTEVYAQSLIMVGVGAGTNYGLNGTWSSWLNGDANQTEALVYMDGDAGKVWRVKSHFATTVGGSAHGQLECYHYIAALTDGSNALGGFRYLGRMCQPYYNLDTPTKDWRGFTSVSWQHGAGPTTVGLTWPFTPCTFTATGGNPVFDTSTNNFYCGETTNTANNMVPGILSSTGTLPTGLVTTKLYYAGTVNAGTTQIRIQNQSFYNPITPSDAGTGVHTFTPIPTCLHFGSLWTADNKGRVQFFQGTGSMTVDGTIRTQFDKAYLVKSRTMFPYNTSYSGVTFGGTILDLTFAYDWNPISTGPIGMDSRGNAGGSPDIGLMPVYHVQHFYNQSAVGDLVARATAFASDFEGVGCFRDFTTKQYPNYGSGTYTGCPAPSAANVGQQNLLFVNGFIQGFTAPTNGSYFNIGQQNLAHKYRMPYYAALIFAEPHFIDLALEAGIGGVLEMTQPVRNPPNSSGYTGAIPAGAGLVTASCGGGGVRVMAWANADLQLAAMLAPLNHPDGTQVCDYIRDLADTNANYPNLVMNSTQLGTYLKAHNSWRPVYEPNARLEVTGGMSFMSNYFVLSQCMAAMRGNADALTWLNTYSGWYDYYVTTFGGFTMYTEYDHGVTFDGAANGLAGVPDEAHYATIAGGATDYMNWTSSGATRFSIDGAFRGYVPTNGDKWIFDPSMTVPGGFSAETPYYSRDVTGNNWNLAASVGGSAILPSDSGRMQIGGGVGEGTSGPWFIPAAPPPASTGMATSTVTGPDSYLTEWLFSFNFAIALGSTGWANARTDADTRATVNAFDYTTNPAFLSQNTFG